MKWVPDTRGAMMGEKSRSMIMIGLLINFASRTLLNFAYTLGATSPNRTRRKVTPITVIKKWMALDKLLMEKIDPRIPTFPVSQFETPSKYPSGRMFLNKKSEITTMAILIKLLLTKIVAKSLLGLSLSASILPAGFDFSSSRLLTSLTVRLKNAISDPETKAEHTNRRQMMIIPIERFPRLMPKINGREIKNCQGRSGSGSKKLEFG